MSLLRRLAVALPVAACLLWAGHARAQEAQPPTAPPPGSPSPAGGPSAAPSSPDPAQAPAPTPAPADATPAPADADPAPSPAAEDGSVEITPWPWPFPWLEASAAPAAAQAADAAPYAPRTPGRRLRPPAALAAPGDAATAQAVAGVWADPASVTPGSGEAPEAPAGVPSSQPGVQISTTTTVLQTCELKAIEHGIAGNGGAVWQVAIQRTDCTWGGGQVLLSYDIRGPPAVDLLAQSGGVNVDVGVYVTKDKVSMAVGYGGSDGVVARFADLALDPTLRSTQDGDNAVDLVQAADSTTGDAFSGNQRLTLYVEGNASALHVLAQNASPAASAASGDAVSENAVDGQAGSDSSGVGDAQAGQVGDNDVALDQDARARSGGAMAGSQEVEVRVTGSVGELAVMAQNASPDATAESGDAIATNDADATAGPLASAGSGAAQAGQVGDNRLRVDQSAHAATGDAVSGSQVIGISVGGSVGELAVMVANDSDGAVAQSGDALASNELEALAGPIATSQSGDAISAQVGDNDVRVDQRAHALSGRALAGAQAVRIQVGGGIGFSAVSPLNLSDDCEAVSGEAEASNDADGAAGPQASGGVALVSQRGRNDVDVDQHLTSETGDAVAGGQVVGQAA